MSAVSPSWGLAQAAAETRAWQTRQHRFGVSFKQGHRVGWADGITFAGTSWATIDEPDREHHRQTCYDTCIFCEAHRVFGECTACHGESEALGPDELSRCCLAPTITGPEDAS